MSVATAGAGEPPAEVLRRFEARWPSMSAADSLRVAGEGSRGLSRPGASLGYDASEGRGKVVGEL